MFKSRNAYPFFQFGEGPREALYLQKDSKGLADDPYRSIAWFVRKAGAFENSEKNFAEFNWANSFRQHKLLEKHGARGMSHALVKASSLAQSSKAKHLPGSELISAKKKEKVVENLKDVSKKILMKK